MNVIANSCAVAGGIVVAKNLKCCALALVGLKNQRDEGDEMRLRLMTLANAAALVGAGGIKLIRIALATQ